MENNIIYPTNAYQTPITKELKKSLKKEIFTELMDTIGSVEFIRNLIAVEDVRGFAKDQPKNKDFNDGRIEVNLTKPHILEDMDFFRERALFFNEHGRYTNLMPDRNKMSEYGRFWKEETRRWKYGYVRPSDGEWIPGTLYFYWNYAPIWLTADVAKSEGATKSQGERIRSFANPWSGDYLFYHYMEQGQRAGMHGKLLKTRGVGYLEPNSSILQQSTGTIRVGDVKVGDMLLDRFGNDTEVLEIYPQGKQDIYLVTLNDGRTVRCGLDHLWSVYDKNKGSKNKDRLYTYKTSELLEKGLFWKNKNGNNLYKFYIPDLAEYVKYETKDLSIPPYVMGALLGDGSMSTGSIKIASDDLEIINKIQNDLGDDYALIKDSSNNNYRIVYKDLYKISGNHIRINPLKTHIIENNWNFTSSFKYIPDIYKYSSYEQRLELVKGLMDTDGSISTQGNLEFSNSNEKLIDDLASVLRSMGISCTKGLGRNPHQKEINGVMCNIKQEYRLYIRTNLNLFNLSRKSERVRKKKLFKNSPIVSIEKLNYTEESTCFLVDNSEHLYLTNDFVPTHNSFKMGALSPRNMYVYPGTGNPNFHLANSKSYLSGNSGIWGKVIDTLDWISDYTPLPRMRLIDSNRDMLVEMGYKDPYGVRRGLGSSVKAISLKDDPEKARGVRGPLIHYEEDGLFDNLERAWGINRKAVEDGNTSFGYMLAGGTGGTEGASFEGSEKLFYYPRTYNVYPLPNIFDRDADGSSECGFFWGAYMNRKDCYDLKTGESDVIKALIEILEDRYVVKYAASDTQAITQKKAEEPITPQEAVMRMTGTVFPVNDLKTYLEEISVRRESFVSEHYIGDLVKKTDGSIQFVPSADNIPLRSYDKVPTDRSGGIEIFTMPRTNANGEIPFGRYIAGIDPIDADTGASLFSVMIMDTFTDRIVAEYTGRPRFADQAYETTLRLLEFYNAEANYEQNLKGIFSYFEKNKALHRLCNTPQILRDMDYVKGATLYGNNAKGTRANKEVNKWGRVLQAEWQKSFDDGVDDRKEAYDEDGNPRKLKLHSLRGIAYIEECIRWNEDGNFDRVSSGGMLFILREDRFQRTQSLKNNDGIGSDLAKDKFFNKNYSFNNQKNNHIL